MPAAPRLSAYEQQRCERIAENSQLLQKLGLDTPAIPPPRARSAARPANKEKRRPGPAEPARKSARLSSETPALAPQAAGTAPPRKPPAAASRWEQRVFAECERVDPAARAPAVFDGRKHHQHLTMSSSSRSVATTGVAGYGAALCAKPLSIPSAKGKPGEAIGDAKEVRAVRLGVGGFAVSVVRSAIKPPFKSLGRSPEALGAYHSSGVLMSAKGERPFGPEYGPGDRVGVLLRRKAGSLELVFTLNGEEVGVAATGIGGTEKLVPAVQPYMGGVALLL
mmetsp:Transcript_33675/g.79723  ORF Transcript_33675/g.79723 Transcript_33675/m.79723 type:complete len:280 (-) Transcript_33675:50-889(-)